MLGVHIILFTPPVFIHKKSTRLSVVKLNRLPDKILLYKENERSTSTDVIGA